ncbi:MAG TPA: penicillin-binding transpeptidase domain-containing protein [Clostridiales bacterium]|nr:penicillin-binding transpeptidase domain-containing protein [Clostridiales bacterium]
MEAKRLIAVLLIFSAIFIGLGYRFFNLQIVQGEKLSRLASAQRISSLEIEKLRGDILDRNEIPFTNRIQKYLVLLKPLLLQGHENDLKNICNILEIDFENVMRDIAFSRKPYVVEADEKKKNIINDLKHEGISIINSLKRYDDTTLARHILGYVNKIDGAGEAGLEKFYNDALEYDTESFVGVITDGKNNVLPGMGYRLMKVQGRNKKLNVKLTLDYHIQKIVEDVMDKHNITGAVVVEEVDSGNITAIASKPDFDQYNIGNYLNSTGKELFNRAVASYNLGSIFKIIDAAAMFELKEHWDEEYFCTGSIKVGDREFKCYSYDKGGHGYVDFDKAFALSCNTYFIDAAIKMDKKSLLEKARRFGLGNITGIREQGIDESGGNIPSLDGWYSDGDIANISIGQGAIMATPLQVADIVATVANGGIKNSVNIVDSIVDDYGNKVREVKRKQGHRVIEKDIADRIKNLMEKVIDEGTGTMVDINEYGGAAGKTGSAETGQYIEGQRVVHAWFAGYFPRKNPRYSIAVFVENGRMGGSAAGPVFEEIAKKIMEKRF